MGEAEIPWRGWIVSLAAALLLSVLVTWFLRAVLPARECGGVDGAAAGGGGHGCSASSRSPGGATNPVQLPSHVKESESGGRP